MSTDIVLQEHSVEVTGTLNAKDGAEITGGLKVSKSIKTGGSLTCRTINLRGRMTQISLQRENSRANIFLVNSGGRLSLGTSLSRGFLSVQGPEGSSSLSSDRCETEKVIGVKHVSAGKPSNAAEGPRRGVDGRISVHSADSDSAQVEILGKTGDIRMVGSVRNLSDSRCKDIHGEIEDALTKIQNLSGVRFRWKTDSSPLKTEDREHLGVVAQEVEKVLPEVVSYDDNGIASVAYSGIIPVLIEALKDEARERQNLEKRLQKVEDIVQKLLEPEAASHQTSKV